MTDVLLPHGSLQSVAVWVTVATLDLDALRSFYANLLGISPAIDQPHRYVEFHLPGLRLGIFQTQAHRWAEFAAARSGSLSLCFEVEDLDQAIAHLHRLGYPPPGDIMTTSHGREIYAYDPQGDRLILHESPQS